MEQILKTDLAQIQFDATHESQIKKSFLDSDNILNFGKKHCGKKIDDIIREDIHYCLWMREQDSVKDDEALFDKLKDLKEPPICMPWGKYKGVSIQTLFIHERKYLEWAKKSEFIKQNKKVYDAICCYV